MVVRVGIAGWRYPGWRGDFYPVGLPQRRELEHASRRLTSIEVNGSFYSLQRPTSYAAWRAETPEDFVFSVKGPRYVTHLKRLVDVDTALANFFASGVLGLGPKLGPVLWQLPETLRFDAGVLDAFLAALPRTTGEAAALAERHDDKVKEGRSLTVTERDVPLRHALEFRSATFADEAAYEVLRRHGVACVLADTAGRWPAVEQQSPATSSTSGCTATGSSTPAATPTRRSTPGPRGAAPGTPTASTSSSTSTTTPRAAHRTTRWR